MITLYIDTETTGLDPTWCQVLQVGMLLCDGTTPIEDCPKFETLVQWKRIVGDSFAINMNRELIARIAKGEGTEANRVAMEVRAFLAGNGLDPKNSINIGAKNASFDLGFLGTLPGFTKSGVEDYHWRHRVTDPGSMYLRSSDTVVPDLKECLKRAGIDKTVEHTALADCIDTCRVVRAALARIWTS